VVDQERMPKGQLRFYRRADLIRANSTAVVQAICKEAPQWQDRVFLVPNPLPDSSPKPGTQPPAKQKQILYAGRIHPEKGIHLLVAAFNRIAARLPDWQLVIAGGWSFETGGGGQPYFDSLRRSAQESQVRFTGLLKEEELNEAYQQAALFCYPSLASQGETFGLAVLEAMAWNCVPVVSELACFTDFVRHGENGIVFEADGADGDQALEKALESLMTNPTYRESLAAAAGSVRDTHQPEHIALQILESIKDHQTDG
jgi:glycosyltransferase involved in cell wall biosynthesis